MKKIGSFIGITAFCVLVIICLSLNWGDAISSFHWESLAAFLGGGALMWICEIFWSNKKIERLKEVIRRKNQQIQRLKEDATKPEEKQD